MMGPNLPPLSSSNLGDVLEILKHVSDPVKAKKIADQLSKDLEEIKSCMEIQATELADLNLKKVEILKKEMALNLKESGLALALEKVKDQEQINQETSRAAKARESAIDQKEKSMVKIFTEKETRFTGLEQTFKDREAKAGKIFEEGKALKEEYDAKILKLRASIL